MQLDIVIQDEMFKPSYANPTDACMDIKAKTNGIDMINPGETKIIHTGLQVKIPEGYVMKMYIRSSIGIKKNLCLANGTGIIDCGYRDEILVALHNFGDKPVFIKDGDRIAQFILLPFPKLQLNIVQDNEDFRNGDRGGGVGSTGV